MATDKNETPAQTTCKLRDQLAQKVSDALQDFETRTGMRVRGLNIINVNGAKTVSVDVSID